MNQQDTDKIDPNNQKSLMYWCNKLGTSAPELRNAILLTGSIDAREIRKYLNRNKFLYHPVKGTKQLVDKTIEFLF